MKLKKNSTKINVEDEGYKKCFELCKDMLTQDPIRAYPDFTTKKYLKNGCFKFCIGCGFIANEQWKRASCLLRKSYVE